MCVYIGSMHYVVLYAKQMQYNRYFEFPDCFVGQNLLYSENTRRCKIGNEFPLTDLTGAFILIEYPLRVSTSIYC